MLEHYLWSLPTDRGFGDYFPGEALTQPSATEGGKGEYGLTTKADYIAELAQDKGQFLPDGMMPASGPATVLAIEKFVGNVTGSVNVSATYTNQYAIAANKLEGFAK